MGVNVLINREIVHTIYHGFLTQTSWVFCFFDTVVLEISSTVHLKLWNFVWETIEEHFLCSFTHLKSEPKQA